MTLSMAFKLRNFAYHVKFSLQNQKGPNSKSDLRTGLNQNKRPYQNFTFPFLEKIHYFLVLLLLKNHFILSIFSFSYLKSDLNAIAQMEEKSRF